MTNKSGHLILASFVRSLKEKSGKGTGIAAHTGDERLKEGIQLAKAVPMPSGTHGSEGLAHRAEGKKRRTGSLESAASQKGHKGP